MTVSANPLARKKPAGYPEAIARIKSAARTALGLSEDAVISVTELNCSDPGCPSSETVVAIFAAEQKPQLFRFHKPILEIGEAELAGGFVVP